LVACGVCVNVESSDSDLDRQLQCRLRVRVVADHSMSYKCRRVRVASSFYYMYVTTTFDSPPSTQLATWLPYRGTSLGDEARRLGHSASSVVNGPFQAKRGGIMYASWILGEDRALLGRTNRFSVADTEHLWTMKTNVDYTMGNVENIVPPWGDVSLGNAARIALVAPLML
jgi:hypothetical protein